MFIEYEETPNPNTLKFLPGRQVLEKGLLDYKNKEDAKESPLATHLFGLENIVGVFLASDFVSVSKTEDTDWEFLKPQVLAALMEFFSSGQEVVNITVSTATQGSDLDSEIEKQIVTLLDERVKPAVAQDGGNIEFVSFDDGIVYLRMEGACAGCPSASATLKSGVENLLKHYIPEVVAVEAVNA